MRVFKLFMIMLLFTAIACSDSSDSSTNVQVGTTDGTGGSLAVFVLHGNYLYTVDNMSLNVFSLIDQSGPVKVNDINVGFDIETLYSNGDYLYIGSQNGMYIYAIASPESPQLLGQAHHVRACDPVVANANTTFVTTHSGTSCGGSVNALDIYDTTSPMDPQLLSNRNLTSPKGLGLYGHYLFVCDDEIKIFDVQNPSEPVLVNSVNKECFDVIIHDNDLFAIGNTGVYRYVLDPGNISNITYVSEVDF